MKNCYERRLRSCKAIIALLVGLALAAPLRAQSTDSPETGTVAGVVVDAQTGETLIGANVVLDGTLIGSTTDIDGHYTIPAVPVGLQTLVFSYIGYTQQTVRNVEVERGGLTRIDIALSPQTVGMDEVVVEARALRNNEAVLLRDRQKALAVSDAISAEAISKSGSSNAADAMEKVTGASVVGGKYVYVRGLGERYASTHLNGAEMPSADPDKKAVQFDLFPANLLDNIVTIKTFTPDKPGNFSGGLVDISTKAFPEELDVKFSAKASFNSGTHFGNDFLTYPGGGTDWLGVDDGTRGLPSLLSDPNLVIPSAQRARRDAELAAMLDAVSKSFNSVMAPLAATAPANSSYSLSIGSRTDLIKRPLGFVVSLTYSRSASSYDNGTTGRYSFTGSDLATDLDLKDALSSDEINWGGIANVSYQFSPRHELGLNTLYSRSAESAARLQEGLWPKELGDDPNSIRTNRYLLYTEREIYSFQLRGKHNLPFLAGTTIEWNASNARTLQDEPDRRFFASTRRTIGTTEVLSASSSGFSDPSRYFRNLDETNRNAALDVSVPFKAWTGTKGKVKFGGAAQRSDRDFRERVFSYSSSPDIRFEGNPETYFAAANMGIVALDTLRKRFEFGQVISDDTKLRNNYDGTGEVDAAYAMIELPLTRALKIVGGARLETTDIRVASRDSSVGIGSLDRTDVLPSVNAVYALTDNMNLRAAFTKTLARPTFREIAPFESFDFTVGDFRIGNPDLDRTRITNYDLRWEWFTRPGEILAVSLFYKDLENPIEEAIVGGTNGQLQYQNVDRAKVYGAEIEVRSALDFIWGRLSNFSTGVNFSLVKSIVDIPETERAAREAVNPNIGKTRELQGQSPYILNADLSYDNAGNGTSVGAFFNVFGRRLSNVSLGGTPDVFERPSAQLDLSVSQRLHRNWSVNSAVKNVLNSTRKWSHLFNDQEFVYQEYNRGQTFSLGVTFRN
ncbi:MAG: TonB-dependent receptor [Rhodothermales bacterium]|nr:TonB-dependent receptor [Rhodothermales bacterium]